MTFLTAHLQTLLLLGGVMHFGILIASALVPLKLKWGEELAKLTLFTRQLVWVHGAFIVMVIIGFGTLTLLNTAALASGTPLARTLCGFIAVFWGVRLSLQIVLFDATPYLTAWWLKLGERGLTVVFTYLTIVYGAAAMR